MKCMKWRKYYPYSRFYEYGKGSETMKKTKIVCTIGPASETEEVLRELIDNGLNIARIDFSCEDQENHKKRIDTIKRIREEVDCPIGIMLDIKDVDDIKFGIENGVDFIAASFIRQASDVLEIRRVLEENEVGDTWIISKIEDQEGIDHIDEIINVSDGIIISRGNLGIEIMTEKIPILQKNIIKKCNKAGKPVITATQMLDSMIRNPRPTRAEATDVANAILDGSDSLMLSEETTIGKYPVEAVKTMSNISLRTEASLDYSEILCSKGVEKENTTTGAISRATCTIAKDLGADAIISVTSSGYTARAVSEFRPRAPIVGATTSKKVMRRLSLIWGVCPVLIAQSNSTDEVIDLSIHGALKKGYIEGGNLIVITAGVPVGVSGLTNLIKVHTVGEVLLKGIGIGNSAVTGKVCVGSSPKEIEGKFEKNDILVSVATDRDMMKYIEEASAIVVEQGGLTSHAAIIGINLGIPTIIGANGATRILKDYEMITVNSLTGLVYKDKTNAL